MNMNVVPSLKLVACLAWKLAGVCSMEMFLARAHCAWKDVDVKIKPCFGCRWVAVVWRAFGHEFLTGV